MTGFHGVLVRVRAGIDVVNNEATWDLQSIDPETGEQYSITSLACCMHQR